MHSLCVYIHIPRRFDLVVSMSTLHAVGPWFAPQPGHTNDHHKNGTNRLPAEHACIRVAQLSKRRGSVWDSLWGHAFKRSPGMKGNCRVLYPTWSSI